MYQWMYEAIHPYVRGKIMEIGSGVGNITELLLQKGHQLKISDPDEKYWRQLTEKYENHANIMGISQLVPFDRHFDDNYARYLGKCYTVILLNTIQPSVEDGLVLSNLKKLVSSNGHLILRLPVRMSLFGQSGSEELDYWRHRNRQTIRKLLGVEFELKETWFFNLSRNGTAAIHSQLSNFTTNYENERSENGLSAIAVAKKNK